MNNFFDQLLFLGILGRPRGIKGELSATWLGGDALPPNSVVFLGKNPERLQSFRVVSSRLDKGKLFFKLDGIIDRTEAEKFTGYKIYVPKDVLPPLEEGEVFLQDLLGAEVFLETGENIGSIDHFEYPAGQQIWAIAQNDGTEILFPAREEFITAIEPANHKVVIAPPPGLLEIYRA